LQGFGLALLNQLFGNSNRVAFRAAVIYCHFVSRMYVRQLHGIQFAQ
jgi:hypothetical protein